MTEERKEYEELKRRYRDDRALKRLIELYLMLELNRVSIMNDKGVDTTGKVKEITGANSLYIEIFTKEAKEENE